MSFDVLGNWVLVPLKFIFCSVSFFLFCLAFVKRCFMSVYFQVQLLVQVMLFCTAVLTLHIYTHYQNKRENRELQKKGV